MFDHVCLGDVEEIGGTLHDILGSGVLIDTPVPRYDLAAGTRVVGHVETTTNCNFACSFCSLTGEARPYRTRDAADITRQIEAMGRVRILTLLDNNFYGNNRASFEARTELLGEHWRRGAFRGWIALVTGDFFKREENIAFVARHGCIGLFSGVESLDPEILKSFNKRQSLLSDPASLSRACARHGIVFDYGLIFDFAQQTMADVSGQMDHLLADPEIPLPGLLSLTIPILGTPYFDAAAKEGRMMPGLRLADLDGQKLVEWPREPLESVVPFVADLLKLRGRKRALVQQALAHALRRRRDYSLDQTLFNAIRPLTRYAGIARVGTPRQMLHGFREKPLTYCAMTDPLPASYRPHVPMAARFEADFQPLLVTDDTGALTEAITDRLHPAPG
ncbi:radical SAM protein [Acuticoccus sp. MNP-M23]|uniref:radical SAM protein n=1 Tax=Acuticoccus sp. MNP-M23 TaxID=3072793 RepID=UPI002816157B|nr:radical SAM protein [Acuticoccus sp. MNP-M23]WMS43233.1 radical SAM protein [Acuticoccus sp. MNP-M23]